MCFFINCFSPANIYYFTKRVNKKQIEILTVLHWSIFPDKIFNPSNTINPAITALVVAIAGIMFPAIAKRH